MAAHETLVRMAPPDRNSELPIYQQIADGMKYGIATGCFGSGDRLPTVDGAAEEWHVNLHTVRRAYSALAEEGLINVQRRVGARVRSGSSLRAPQRANLNEFLTRIVDEAHRNYGLGTEELSDLIRGQRIQVRARGVISIVECNEEQVAHHAGELSNAFALDVVGMCLSAQQEPGPGPICATYFHAQEVAARWPHRIGDIVIVAIEPSPEIVDQIRDAQGRIPPIILHETNVMRASLIEMQLRAMPGLKNATILTEIVRSINDAPGAIHLYAPRLWAKLRASERARPRTFELPYRIRTNELARLGPLFDTVH